MPAWLHFGHVHAPVSVFDPSCSQVDFFWNVGFVVLVTVVVLAHKPSSFGIIVDLDLPRGPFKSGRIDIFDGTDNGSRHGDPWWCSRIT